MSLSQEYLAQQKWRDWEPALRLCPLAPGQRVLDLGCGPGALTRKLMERGAIVTGIDGNADLLAAARAESHGPCEFLQQDLLSLDLPDGEYDGIWCSFTVAYFTDFERTLQHWLKYLKPEGWICLVEVDDLLGHRPMPANLARQVENFYAYSLQTGKYDFRLARRLGELLQAAGFTTQTCLLTDRELSTQGTLAPDVQRAWRQRLERMPQLQKFLGAEYDAYQAQLLATVASEQHTTSCRVFCAVGTRGETRPGRDGIPDQPAPLGTA